MSVDKELFLEAVRLTERYLPDPSKNPTQQEVASALVSKLPNLYRALETVAKQIEDENQRGDYAHLQLKQSAVQSVR